MTTVIDKITDLVTGINEMRINQNGRIFCSALRIFAEKISANFHYLLQYTLKLGAFRVPSLAKTKTR